MAGGPLLITVHTRAQTALVDDEDTRIHVVLDILEGDFEFMSIPVYIIGRNSSTEVG